MRSKNDFWQRVIPSLWLILGIIVYLAYSFLFNRQMLDSDMASEMVLADLLNQEHSIITKNWIYSTEIRVIGMQWFYRVGLLLSSDNWYLARIIGTAIGLILYLLSWKYLLRELNIKGAVVYIISMLIWPFGFWYYYDVIWGGYYIPHSIMMILSFVLLLSASKVSEKRQTKQRVILVAIIVIALLSGLNGVRQAMLFYIPLTLYGFVILAMDYHKNKSLVLYRNTKSLFAIYSFVASFFNILGYGINMKLFVNNYCFTSYDNMVWGNGTNSIMEALGWYFDGFGLFDYPSKSLFSIAGVGAGRGLLLGGVVLISIVRLSMNYKKLDVDIQIFLGVILSMLFVVSVVFTFVWGERQYWAPLIQFGVAAIFIELSTDEIFDCKERLLLCNFLMALAVISSMGTIKANLEQPLRANKDFNPVILFIKSQGYTQGIASFWHSNVVTELTNGDVEMWTKTSEYDDTDRWLTKSAHDGIPEGNYFILCAKEDGEDKNIGNYNQINNVSGKKVYEDANYVIYEYN